MCAVVFLFVYTRRRQVPFSTVSLVCKLIREIMEKDYTFGVPCFSLCKLISKTMFETPGNPTKLIAQIATDIC